MRFRVPGGRRRGVIRIAGGATLVDEQEPEDPGSFDALLAGLVSSPRNDALLGRTSFRGASIAVIQDRVVIGSDRLRLTIEQRRQPRPDRRLFEARSSER